MFPCLGSLHLVKPRARRFAAIVGEIPAMTAQLFTRTGEDAFSTEGLFETIAKPLSGFPQKERFVF